MSRGRDGKALWQISVDRAAGFGLLVLHPVAQYQLSTNIAWRKVGDEAFLITRDGAMTHLLNPTATRAFELVLEGKSLAEVIDVLSNEFTGAPETIRGDVAEWVETMVSRRILIRQETT